MKFFLTLFLCFYALQFLGQEPDTAKISALEAVTIKAFEQQQKWKNVAAAVGFLSNSNFQRFSGEGIVQAVNTVPGVRMEQRSPGSYRLNIRGSSLRSPFGVRNVKIYYNGIPFTDPSGQSYLNAFGTHNFHSLEIIKGPGSSVYGAGTGGAMLIESMGTHEPTGVEVEGFTANYETAGVYAGVATGTDANKSRIGFQYLKSEGYRMHSAMNRTVASWDGRFSPSKTSSLKTTFLFSKLYYETPGGLTRTEYAANAKAARPAGGGFPGAEAAGAAIKQSLVLAGLSYQQKLSASLSNTTSAYGSFTELLNPAIRNYGRNLEPHAGGRTAFNFKKDLAGASFQVVAGGEWQQSFSSVYSYKNRNGQRDSLQTADDVPARQALVFLQFAVESKGWVLVGGGSLNFVKVKVWRSYPTPLPQQERRFSNELAPRVSLSKKWKDFTVYTSLAKGFSPPTTAELLPSGSAINLSLNPEEGINNDLGLRGRFGRLSFDVNAFLFRLKNTIVQRRDAAGGDYYTNAGSTSQKGLETSVNYSLFRRANFIRESNLWLSHTWHHFRYKEFKQLTTDYSGNALPGVAPQTLAAGFDCLTKNGWQLHLNCFFSDRTPLNDANSDHADAYQLLNFKLGYTAKLSDRFNLTLNAGADNLLDEKYSLGNDVNAAGGRYFNAAARRSFYFGLSFSRISKKEN